MGLLSGALPRALSGARNGMRAIIALTGLFAAMFANAPADAQTANALTSTSVNCGGGCERSGTGVVSLKTLGLTGPLPARITSIVSITGDDPDFPGDPSANIVGDLCVQYNWGQEFVNNLVVTVAVANSNNIGSGGTELTFNVIGGSGGSNPQHSDCTSGRSQPPQIVTLRAVTPIPEAPAGGTANVTFEVVASDNDAYDQQGTGLTYRWYRDSTPVTATGGSGTGPAPLTRTVTLPFAPGSYPACTVSVEVTDSVAPQFVNSGTNTVTQCVGAFTVAEEQDNPPVIVTVSGPTLSPQPEQLFTLHGVATDDRWISSMQWFRSTVSGSLGELLDSRSEQQLTGLVTFDVQHSERNPGTYYYYLRVTDGSDWVTISDPVVVVVGGGNQPPNPTLTIRPNPVPYEPGARNVAFMLDASGTEDDGQPGPLVFTYSEVVGGEDVPISTDVCPMNANTCTIVRPAEVATRTFRVTVSDGEYTRSAVATVDVAQTSRELEVSPPVVAPAQPTALEGEYALVSLSTTVTLDGQPPAPDQQVTYRWTVDGTDPVRELGTTAQLTDIPFLSGATYRVRVTVTVGSLTRSATTDITVGVSAPPARQLSELASLTPNQRSMGGLVDRTCDRLQQIHTADPNALTPAQQDLLSRCGALKNADNSLAAAVSGLNAMDGQEINALATQSRNFSNLQLTNLSSRLVALRQGVKGISTAGLNVLDENGNRLPLQELASLIKYFAGGAGGDEEGGLLDERLGIFINGSVRTGKKDETPQGSGFDFDSSSLTIGADFRIRPQFVVGGAVGYGRSKTDLGALTGRFDGDTLSFTAYGSAYGEHLYVDFLAGYGSLDFESVRRIRYVEYPGEANERLIDQTALGNPDGDQVWLGFSAGWDFSRKGWSFTPELSLSYVESTIDAFNERIEGTGLGSGLALAFDKQTIESLTMRGGMRAAYSISKRWGVITPQVRLAYVHEFEDDPDVIRVDFVNSPFANDPTQPELGAFVVTEVPDKDYFSLSAGVSVQFARGISAFVDYETLEQLKSITSHEFSFGIRFQRTF